MVKETTATPGIYAAMAAVMRDLEAIGKTKNNQQQGFKYRGIDDVYNAIHPLLAKHGIFCTPEVIVKDREERTNSKGTVLAFTTLRIRYTFWTEDGSSVSCVVEGEGMDSGDKSSNKAMAVGHKYALLQTFCIPTEDMPDPDAETHEVSQRGRPAPRAAGAEDPDKVLAKYKTKLVECENLSSLQAIYSTAYRALQPYNSPDHLNALVDVKDEVKARLEATVQ